MKRRIYLVLLAMSLSLRPALADYVSGGGGSGGGGGAVSSVSNSDGTITISPTTGAVVVSLPALNSGNILVGNASNKAASVALSGDATLANTGAITLANTAVTAGSYTSTNLTVDTKGRITAAANGSGGGGGTVNSGTANQTAYYASTGTVISGNPNLTVINGALTAGQTIGPVGGSLQMFGSTSGNFTEQPSASTTSWLFKWPAAAAPTPGYLMSAGTVVGTTITGSWVAPGTATGYANNINGFRLTLTSNVPVTTSNVTGATTLYWTPANGNGFVDGAGTYSTPPQLSAAIPSYAHRIYDVSVPNGAASLEYTPWDATPVTATITGITAGLPAQFSVSSASGFSTGDTVYIDNIVGTVGTMTTIGVNTKAFPISVSGTTITIPGLDTTGLLYTSGGTMTRIPAARNTSITWTNGVPLMASDSSRYVGTIMTVASGTCEDSTQRAFLFNQDNPKPRPMSSTLPIFAYYWTGASAYAVQSPSTNTGLAVVGAGRLEYVTGLPVTSAHFDLNANFDFGIGNGSLGEGIGINTLTGWSLPATLNTVANAGGNPYPLSGAGALFPSLGYSFAQAVGYFISGTSGAIPQINSQGPGRGMTGEVSH